MHGPGDAGHQRDRADPRQGADEGGPSHRPGGPGGRIERVARQSLSWGRLISSEEIKKKVDALEVEHVREAGRRLLKGVPTLAAIGPIKDLPSLDGIASALRG